jgi:hypothetical protein
MSDEALQVKFMANATAALGEARALEVSELVWSLDRLPDARVLVEACA